jgi:hypothetical protein
MRVNPTSATTTILQYEVYRHKDAPTEVFDELDAFFKQVEGEDKQLCEGAQRNLNAGVYVNGVLHPSTEKVCFYSLSYRLNPSKILGSYISYTI